MRDNDPEAGKPWKITLAALVGIFLIAMAATMVIAARKVSRVVDPDYYMNGLHYGQRDINATSGKR
ncbi:MAG: FixH family protein [Geobacteraceae bacterium]|nr:FixH family protein [Geobacteraceae bacterium]